MSDGKRIKKVGSLKMELLKGRSFDIRPSKEGGKGFFLTASRDFTRFALIAFLAFVGLNFGHAYLEGREVLNQSTDFAFAGYEDLQSGLNHLILQDPEQALIAFEEAESSFKSLEETTSEFTLQQNDLLEESYYLETADLLVGLALDVSEMGQQLSELMQSVKSLPEVFLAEEEAGNVMDLVNEKKADLNELIELSVGIQQKLAALKINLIPESLHPKIEAARDQMGQFVAILFELRQFSNHLTTLLGDRVPHRYLILLQNNHESRATGGFIGSYIIMDVNDGRIAKIEPRDVYASDGQMRGLLPAPAGIDQVSDYWFMRDANYSPDFPSSAKQLMWFLEQSRGPSVDTVIAIDQTVVESMLGVMGEIELDRFPVPITAENFSQVISFYTEAKLSETDTPKQLLFDMIPVFNSRLAEVEDVSAVIEVVQKMIDRGHVQFYSKDPELQSTFEHYNLAGEMISPQEKLDYLSVISTSIGGNKSDGFMDIELSHQTTVGPRGELTNELKIQKAHQFSNENKAEVQSLIDRFGTGQHTAEDLHFILGGGENLDYMRVYVPLGSELESVEGVKMEAIEVSEEFGYTVFGFVYGPVEAGASEEVRLTYVLPFDLDVDPIDNYRFVAERQAGVESLDLNKTLKISDLLEVKKQFPEGGIEGGVDGVQFFMAAVSSL